MINSNKLLLITLSIIASLWQTSCNTDDDDANDRNALCDGAVCTAIFVQINVSLTDQEQNPVALDSYTVTNLENGNDMTISLSETELNSARETGLYLLTQDGVLELNEARRIQFKGFIDDQEVISSDYTVSTDCCHVSLDSGNLQLSI